MTHRNRLKTALSGACVALAMAALAPAGAIAGGTTVGACWDNWSSSSATQGCVQETMSASGYNCNVSGSCLKSGGNVQSGGVYRDSDFNSSSWSGDVGQVGNLRNCSGTIKVIC